MPETKNINLGIRGENAARDLLLKNGYKILERNYRSGLGEIDIIARDKGTLCFVEVKTRRSDRCGLPQEALIKSKQRQIAKSALVYLKENKFLDKKARFDVVWVACANGIAQANLIKNAFELDESFTY